MLHIGDYAKVCRNVTILAHDYSRSVVIMKEHENIGEARTTYIGNNVFIGMNTIILMGSHIGDNSIVGAGSVVSGCFPDDVVIAGNPAKIICTIQEYTDKRRTRTLCEAVEYAKCWKNEYGKLPSIREMGNAFSWLYLPRTQETIDEYPEFFRLSGVDNEQLKIDFLNSKAHFESYEVFCEYVEEHLNQGTNQ